MSIYTAVTRDPDARFDPPDEDGSFECTVCTRIYMPDDDATFESGDMCICSMCTEEKDEELVEQVVLKGYSALTTDELLFLEYRNEQ